MELSERIQAIMTENKLIQKDFAAEIGVSDSYISGIMNEKNKNISKSLALLIGILYGYNPEWILNGTEPKMKQFSEEKPLTDIHQRAIMKIEKLSGTQVKAILAFVEALEHIHDIFQEEEKKDPETE